MQHLFKRLREGATNEDLQKSVAAALASTIAKQPVATQYRVLILHDDNRLLENDSDRIYTAINKYESKDPILLVIYSPGGAIGPAYMIGKMCRRSSPDRFLVAVPRKAKSAATLIACAADEIHMGMLSELGPIDPHLDDVPAIALKNSIEHIASLTSQYPKAAEMFAQYLSKSLSIEQLGHYERLVESAEQYAERLLAARAAKSAKQPKQIATQLVREYKDHSFVIDSAEATSIFGPEIVRYETDEYRLANAIYESLSFLRIVLDVIGKRVLYFVGSPSDGAVVFTPKT